MVLRLRHARARRMSGGTLVRNAAREVIRRAHYLSQVCKRAFSKRRPDLAETEQLVHGLYPEVVVCVSPEVSRTVRSAITSGYYEDGGVARLLAVLQDGDRLVEIGGGLGFLGSVVGSVYKLESHDIVEANPALIPLLQATLRSNGVENARVHHCILTDDEDLLRQGQVEFYLHEDIWASSVQRTARSRQSVHVATKSFSAFIQSTKPTVIHADVEGAEEFLFAHSPLEGVRALTVEIHSATIGRAGMKRVFDDLAHRGFVPDPRFSDDAVVSFFRA